MSRFYSGSKGKSGSKKPSTEKTQDWIRYNPDEAELLVVKLYKEGHMSGQIGKILRDTYGIPSVRKLTGKRVATILKEHNIEVDMPDDLKALMIRALAIRTHLEKNKQDESAKRGLTLTESKIKRLAKYYISNDKLPSDWRYDPSKLKMLVG